MAGLLTTKTLDCKDLHSYLKTLSSYTLDRLYNHPATCLAVFRYQHLVGYIASKVAVLIYICTTLSLHLKTVKKNVTTCIHKWQPCPYIKQNTTKSYSFRGLYYSGINCNNFWDRPSQVVRGADNSQSGHFSVSEICRVGQFSVGWFAGTDISQLHVLQGRTILSPLSGIIITIHRSTCIHVQICTCLYFGMFLWVQRTAKDNYAALHSITTNLYIIPLIWTCKYKIYCLHITKHITKRFVKQCF